MKSIIYTFTTHFLGFGIAVNLFATTCLMAQQTNKEEKVRLNIIKKSEDGVLKIDTTFVNTSDTEIKEYLKSKNITIKDFPDGTSRQNFMLHSADRLIIDSLRTKNFKYHFDSASGDSTMFFRFRNVDSIMVEREKLFNRIEINKLDSSAKYQEISIIRGDSSGNKSFIFNHSNEMEKLRPTEVEILFPDGTREKTVIFVKEKKEAGAKKSEKEKGKTVGASKAKELEVKDLAMYPNPSNGKFNLAFSVDKPEKINIRIIDSAGKAVYKETLPNFSGTYNKDIDLTGKAAGVYHLELIQGKNKVTRKMVVK